MPNLDYLYQEWIIQNHHSFKSKSIFNYEYINQENKDLFIPMPPPNITGKLHLGHSLFLTIQDSIIRFNKNKGNTCLWIPGLDHAGLATFEKIEAYMKEKNCSYEQASIELPNQHKETILLQIKKMGSLPDWNFLTYTLDEDYQNLTKRMIKLLLKEKRIYFKEGNFFLNLKDYAKDLLKSIQENDIKIIPEYESKNLFPFLENNEDWNISRQIPWGTKIPIKINPDSTLSYDEEIGSDCLDTWFNSSLWIQACLQKDESFFEKFYPAECIETGSDILFFWCARMLIMGSFMFDNQKELNIKIPSRYSFKKIYLHGLIRDKHGKKFSKSIGNGIDPLEMIEKYGTDALRLYLITRSGPSEDIKFNENDLSEFKKFINKIYQSARFFSMYASKLELEKLEDQKILEDNKYLKELQTKFSSLMNSYRFLEASRLIQSEFKSWFCNIYIEENKEKIQALDEKSIIQGILILNQMIALIESFCPFISYYINKTFLK